MFLSPAQFVGDRKRSYYALHYKYNEGGFKK